MKNLKDRQLSKGLISIISVLAIVVSVMAILSTGLFAQAVELGAVISDGNTSTVATQEGCAIKIETKEKVSWTLPRQPIDLVVIQDASGSFAKTMPNIKEALKKVTETTTETAYDEKNPKLVFTDNPKTTDRVMITSYAGIDVARRYDDISIEKSSSTTNFILDSRYSWRIVGVNKYAYGDTYTYAGNITYFYEPGEKITDYYGNVIRIAGSNYMNIAGMYARGYHANTTEISKVYGTDSNFTDLVSTVTQPDAARYRFETTGKLMSSTDAIDTEIDSISTGGGTPTVPAIEDAIAQYNAVKNNDGGMANNRKTVFLLITDGIANGYRDKNSNSKTVYIDRSLYRTYTLMKDWGTSGNWPEAGQNYLARANELAEAGKTLQAAAGDNGKVVVGFWEDKNTLEDFNQGQGYLYAYENAFGTPDSHTNLNTGDDRSIREVFTTALKSVASPSDKLATGEDADYYVEDTDIDQFSAKILKSITAAIKKDDVSGNFTVTEGY